jgi:hypothetical protein
MLMIMILTYINIAVKFNLILLRFYYMGSWSNGFVCIYKENNQGWTHVLNIFLLKLIFDLIEFQQNLIKLIRF